MEMILARSNIKWRTRRWEGIIKNYKLMTIYIFSLLLFMNINMAMIENGRFDEKNSLLERWLIAFQSLLHPPTVSNLILINIEQTNDWYREGWVCGNEKNNNNLELKIYFDYVEVLMMSEKKLLKTMSWRFLHCGTLIHDGFLIMFSFYPVDTHILIGWLNEILEKCGNRFWFTWIPSMSHSQLLNIN